METKKENYITFNETKLGDIFILPITVAPNHEYLHIKPMKKPRLYNVLCLTTLELHFLFNDDVVDVVSTLESKTKE